MENKVDKALRTMFLLVGLGYIVAAITWSIIGNVNEKFFTRFLFGMICLGFYSILRKLK